MVLRGLAAVILLSIFVLFFYPVSVWAEPPPGLDDDLKVILQKANLSPTQITTTFVPADPSAPINSILVRCDANQNLQLEVKSISSETAPTLYWGLHRLGFLFPNPTSQISPTVAQLNHHCGEAYRWRPSVAVRGFHLHTEHPNEWVAGFLMGRKDISAAMVQWLARNFQNVFEVELVRGDLEKYGVSMSEAIQLAHRLGMRVGIGVSFAMIQQRSFHLIPPWRALLNYDTKRTLETNALALTVHLPVDYVSVELGSTEFTPFSYAHTLEWLNELGADLLANKKFLMAKVHASTNQFDDEHGNYNFLPREADLSVGVLPHTVYFYGLDDDNTPIYGRKNFADILQFMTDENPKRETWYYPETSYFVGMDIDVPLLLTDYLRVRAHDYKKIADLKIKGHLTFTSGQELGYWLFDWNTALQASADYLGDEMAALRLLGERLPVWQKIMDFQTQYFKKGQLVQMLTAENLLDELPLATPIHERLLIRDLFHKDTFLVSQIQQLEEALKNAPGGDELNEIKNSELRRMMQVTFLRLQHALYIRRAIADRRDPSKKAAWLNKAMQVRESALGIMIEVERENAHYPQSFNFSQTENPTSYQYGYCWPARNLYFWEREEGMVSGHLQNPFYHNLYNPFYLLF